MAYDTQRTISEYADRANRYKSAHEVDEHERDVYMCFCDNYDGASNIPGAAPPTPRLVKIVPSPRVVDKNVQPVTDRAGGSARAMILADVLKFEVTGISRRYQEADLNPTYFVIVPKDTELTPAQARDAPYKYSLLGKPQMMMRDWKISLKQFR
ncbi:MAG TPA: hypothetical protein VI756_06155 [Blastocatellia bacterium]